MSSQWDWPERIGTAPDAGAQPATAPRDGLFDPLSFLRFIRRNILMIGAFAIAAAVGGVLLVRLVPFPYHATATVLVDPRDPQVTLQEGVLRPIGSDAAVLESMVLILKSDGFLLDVMDRLGLLGSGSAPLSEQARLEALASFKRDLDVERRGATYLVEVSFNAPSAAEAARIANQVATSFADTQNGYVSDANEQATQALAARLVELRRKLDASEKAVADFAAQHGILYIDGSSTLQSRQLAELSSQLANARTSTEEARARYQRQVESGGVVLSDARAGEPAQLAYLRQQRAQLMQTLEQQNLTYGARHPRMVETRRLIEGIDRQIAEEKQTLVRQLKGALDVAEAQQKKLEDDVARMSSQVVLTEADEVRLEALRREAAADRDIYEKFLARNKTTDELAEMKSENVRVVSPAVSPLRSTRPSAALIAPVFALLGAIAGTALAAVTGQAPAVRRKRADVVASPEDGPSPDEPEAAPLPRRSETAPARAHPPLLMLARPSRVEAPAATARRPAETGDRNRPIMSSDQSLLNLSRRRAGTR